MNAKLTGSPLMKWNNLTLKKGWKIFDESQPALENYLVS